MNYQQLHQEIQKKQSFLCVGLDPDPAHLPESLPRSSEGLFEFNRRIVDATADFAVAYKPNVAFFESQGLPGMKALRETAEYIKDLYPEQLLIADAKRGDIGNTAKQYAKAFFEDMPFDAITLSPYMGSDSIQPFLEYPDKWSIILGLTSNASAADFQQQPLVNGQLLYENVLQQAARWGTPDNTMFVIGATQAEALEQVRAIIPDHFLLVPGIGAQGGSLQAVAQHGINAHTGLLVNSSRGIIFAGQGPDFDKHAHQKAQALQSQMADLLKAGR